MPLYVIQCGQNGPVKIGYSDDPYTRLGDLQTSHWEELFLRALIDGNTLAERLVHKEFADRQIREEWFQASVLDDLPKLGRAFIPIEGGVCVGAVLALWLQKERVSRRDFADALGVPTRRLNDWISGRKTPEPVFLEAIERETDGAITAAHFQRQADALGVLRTAFLPSPLPCPHKAITQLSRANNIGVTGEVAQ